LQVAAYFAGQVSGVDKREGKEKEKERGNGKINPIYFHPPRVSLKC